MREHNRRGGQKNMKVKCEICGQKKEALTMYKIKGKKTCFECWKKNKKQEKVN